jgi:hypothetical protein
MPDRSDLRAGDQSGHRSHGLRHRVWPAGCQTAGPLFLVATAALRTVANAVQAISGTASADLPQPSVPARSARAESWPSRRQAASAATSASLTA